MAMSLYLLMQLMRINRISRRVANSCCSCSNFEDLKLTTTAKFRLNIHFFIGGIPDWQYMTLKMHLCIKKAFCVLKVTIFSGGQMTAWPVFARCNGGQKTVSPKQNGLLTTGHRSNRWSRGRWSEGGTPIPIRGRVVVVVLECSNNDGRT